MAVRRSVRHSPQQRVVFVEGFLRRRAVFGQGFAEFVLEPVARTAPENPRVRQIHQRENDHAEAL